MCMSLRFALNVVYVICMLSLIRSGGFFNESLIPLIEFSG